MGHVTLGHNTPGSFTGNHKNACICFYDASYHVSQSKIPFLNFKTRITQLQKNCVTIGHCKIEK